MKNLVIAGPYNPAVKEILINNFSDTYSLTFVIKQEELLKVPQAEYLILRTLRVGRPELDAMPNLRYIQRWGAGYDTIDIRAAGERGVTVANFAGVNAPAVAEQALLLMLAVNRNLLIIDKSLRRGEWIKVSIEKTSYMLAGKRVGVIGAGSIGKILGGFVRALGGHVQYYDIRRLPSRLEEEQGFTYADLETLFRTSDVISLHVPLSDSTRYMINKDSIALMKRNVVIVNTSRGGIINEADLYQALVDGRVAGAGLDCFETEPVTPGSMPFAGLDNVVLSCHIGGNTADIVLMIAEKIPDLVNAFDKGELDTKYIVNEQYLPSK